MPELVQLKLLSKSGELLKVSVCQAGRISVLRAAIPSHLRPYQRALGGSSAADNIEVVCDGREFKPEDHTVIGFGEHSPTTGWSVRDFLISRGISELAVASQLLSVGLEDVQEKRCADLTLDQESRLRLLAATANPNKVLVLNDPFENISGKWRERIAELLLDFAGSRRALVIIPCLTYRPEVWIESPLVERIEVGQTAQRTIGFAAAGSQNNASIDELRRQLKEDPRFSDQVVIQERFSQGTSTNLASGAAAAGIAAGISGDSLTPNAVGVGVGAGTKGAGVSTFTKLLVLTLAGGSIGGVAIYSTLSPKVLLPTTTAAKVSYTKNGDNKLALNLNTKIDPGASALNVKDATNKEAPSQQQQQQQGAEGATANVAKVNLTKPTAAPTPISYILDSYPAPIKSSLLDTTRGSIDFGSVKDSVESQPGPERRGDAGNLFSLLEAAGNQKGASNREVERAGDYYNGDSDYEESASREAASPEDAKREDIRRRFLAAIKASADKRRLESQEEGFN
jgi:hypothetical protein